MRFLILIALAGTVALGACRSPNPDDVTAIRRITPAAAAPGGALMLTGRGLDRVVAVTVGGRPAGDVTPVSATLLTVVVPADAPAGEQSVELATAAGRRVSATIRVEGGRGVAGIGVPSSLPAAPPSPATSSAATPPPTRTATPSPPPARVAAQPAPPAPASRGEKDDEDDKEEKEDKKKDDQRGGRGR